jgi:hypothetical protein
MKIKHTTAGLRKIAVLGLAAVLTGLPVTPSLVSAQSQSGIQLTIDGCDTQNYPSVTCTVLPTEGSGVPSRGIDGAAFEVYVDDTLKATDLKVEEFDEQSVRTDTMLLVDFGMTQNGKAIESLRGVTRQIVQNARDTDNIGFIAVMGKIDLGDTLNPPLNEKQEMDFKSAMEARNYIINMVNGLDPQPKTPLYDALCKALILTAKRKVGARAVVVMSDGNDKKASASCEAGDPITRANKDRVPVFAVAVGNNLNAGYLNRLAIQTNGVYLVASDFAQGADRYREIQTILRTRYRISFTSPLPADAAAHKINVRLTLPSGKAADAVSFSATAPYPLLESLVMGAQRLNDGATLVLPSNDVTVQALFVGRPVSRVEFDLETKDGTITRKATAEPWTYTFSDRDLQGVDRASLTIHAYGMDDKDVGTFKFEVQPVQPVQAAVSQDPGAPEAAKATEVKTAAGLPQPATASSSQSMLQRLMSPPTLYVLIGLLVIIVGAIAAVIIIGVRNRKAAATYQPTSLMDMFNPSTAYTQLSTFEGDGATQLVGGDAAGDSHTMVLGGDEGGKTMVLGGDEGGKTMVYSPPVARLKITSGPQSGKTYDLGSAMSRNVAIGRDVQEDMAGNIRLTSKFVSRLHARIALVDDVLYLNDERSASGTKVDGVPLREGERMALKPGMVLHFGDVSAVVETP